MLAAEHVEKLEQTFTAGIVFESAVDAHDGEQAFHSAVIIALGGQVAALLHQGFEILWVRGQALLDLVQRWQVGELGREIDFGAQLYRSF